jgi:hypothetical protein
MEAFDFSNMSVIVSQLTKHNIPRTLESLSTLLGNHISRKWSHISHKNVKESLLRAGVTLHLSSCLSCVNVVLQKFLLKSLPLSCFRGVAHMQ